MNMLLSAGDKALESGKSGLEVPLATLCNALKEHTILALRAGYNVGIQNPSPYPRCGPLDVTLFEKADRSSATIPGCASQ